VWSRRPVTLRQKGHHRGPTYNERDNVEALLHRLVAACRTPRTEIVFVDDSHDGHADVDPGGPSRLPIPISVQHRQTRKGASAAPVSSEGSGDRARRMDRR